MYKNIVYSLGILSLLSILSFGYGPISNPEVHLGEKLFFDPILSETNEISCASCHKPEFAFADTVAISPGINGKLGTRNAPSVMNMAFRDVYFFDGRAQTLEQQVPFPITDHNEMGLDLDKLVARLKADTAYLYLFNDVYKQLPSVELISRAIAAFENSLETANTPFDLWMNDIDNNAMSESALRGRALFLSDRTRCFDCHFSPDFTGDEFRNIGLYDGTKYTDKGRFLITKDSADLGKFKVPGLRNVAVTPPYMHDGSLRTLDDVLDFYSDIYAVIPHPINMDSILFEPLHLSADEKSDLKAFLMSLNDIQFMEKAKKLQNFTN